MSSSRPTNGLTKYAPALAASIACAAEKHSVTFTRMPSLLSAEQASMPSRIRGTFTITFLWILASSRPSEIIAFASTETTSALTGPSTMPQMAAICSLIGLPSLAIRLGLVVTPSTMPHLAPARSSSRFAVSRNNSHLVFSIEAGAEAQCHSVFAVWVCRAGPKPINANLSPSASTSFRRLAGGNGLVFDCNCDTCMGHFYETPIKSSNWMRTYPA